MLFEKVYIEIATRFQSALMRFHCLSPDQPPLRVPPGRLRAVNLAIEQNAWGAFRTEFYPTYDFRPVWESTHKQK